MTQRQGTPPQRSDRAVERARRRRLLQHSSALQLLVDASTGAIVDASPAACAFYGYDPVELAGLHLRDLDTAAPEQVAACLGEAASEARSVFSARHRLASGEVRDVEVHSGPLRVAGRGRLYLIVHDVSDRTRTQHALEQQVSGFAAAMDGMAILDARGRFVFLNGAHAHIYGYERPDELIGRSWRTLYLRGEARRLEAQAVRTLGREGRWRGEAVGRRRDGTTFDQEISLSALPDGAMVCVVRDTSDRKRAEHLQSALFRITAMALGAEDLQALYAGLHGLVAELLYARNFLIALYDAATDRLSFPYFVDEHDPPPPPQAPGDSLIGRVLRTGQPLLADPAAVARLRRAEGTTPLGSDPVDWLGVPLKRGSDTFGVVALRSYSRAVRFSQADLELLTFVSQHIGAAVDRTRAGTALRESEARFRTLAQTAPCAIFIYQDQHFVYANDACLDITGRSREEFLRLAVWELVAPEFRELVRERSARRPQGEGMPARYEFRLERPDGEERWLDYSAGVIEYAGRPAVLGTAFDVTQRKRAEEQIRSLAYHDPLTGLPNRRLCGDRLFMAVAQAHRLGQPLAVLFLDLDRFKAVNDALGHDLGDQLLRTVGERLLATVREGDTVARLGGDEFVLLLPGTPRAADAVLVAEKVLEALRRPFAVQGRELRVTASMGVALYPADGADPESLLRNADAAMYRAKGRGRDGYQLYAPAMSATTQERLTLERELRRALEAGELELHYQPVVDLRSGRIVEAEALLRWPRADGFVSPADFIPLAETTGLMAALGPWVLERACEQAQRWRAGGHDLCVAVNLSARQLQQPDLASQVDAALRRAGLPHRCLRLDTTEAAVLQSGEGALETLRRLRGQGVGLNLDDFGAGAASLSELRRLPLDAVKLDPLLVRGATSEAEHAAMLSAVIQLAHALRLHVVAEGVETDEQRAVLVERGCDRLQGFVFSPALPPEAMQRLLDKHAPTRQGGGAGEGSPDR